MKMKLLILWLALMPFISWAQDKSITVISEDGEGIYLWIDGQQQNEAPHPNVCIDGLAPQTYEVRITFADKWKKQIVQNINILPYKKANADAVYHIIKDEEGNMALRPYLPKHKRHEHKQAPDIYIVHYGYSEVKRPVQAGNPTGSSTEMEIGYGAAPPQAICKPMDEDDFNAAKKTIQDASFEESKLNIAKSILTNNCLSSEEVKAVCRLFSYDQTRLQFAKLAYPKATDKSNYFKVNDAFEFDGSKSALSDFINNGGK